MLPKNMDRWKQYLFKSHSEATLRAWAKRLHIFRFFRAYGGQTNDGDSLDVAYEYEHVSNLHHFFDYLGIPLTIFTARPPQPEPGVSYPAGEFDKFPFLIPGTQWIEQPGHCSIVGEKAFVYCKVNRIKISLSTGYFVTEADVRAAEEIEKVLVDAPLVRVDPPVDDEHCICPKYYPDYFS